MIDVHCHLEQKDYEKDRDEVIEKCKEQLKAVITSCAHPNDFNLTMEMTEKHPDFVFATAGIHPEYIKDITVKEIDEFLGLVKANKDKLVAVGEVGLDYWWIKEKSWQWKQKELFVQFINLAKEIKKPLVIHIRDAFEDSIRILEDEDANQVMIHMFGGREFLSRVVENGWSISLNTMVLRSKKHRKIARDVPLDRLMIDTDAPWLDPQKGRNTPLSVKVILEKIAEIKKMPFEELDKATTENAVKFFNLV